MPVHTIIILLRPEAAHTNMNGEGMQSDPEIERIAVVRRGGPFTVSFSSRHQIVTICVRLLNVEFPGPGMYFVVDIAVRPHANYADARAVLVR